MEMVVSEMWHRTKTQALTAALASVDRRVDPEALIEAAKSAGVTLPIRCERVSAPSLGGHVQLAWRCDEPFELRRVVDRLIRERTTAA